MDMKRNSIACGNLGTYTSPGTPDYKHDTDAGILPKGWSSERVPFKRNSGTRHTHSVSALMPLRSGRTLPSKWDDAERWITSPISVAQAQRQPMSKSCPLGAQEEGFSNYSPAISSVRGFTSGSPFTTGVLSINCNGRHGNGLYYNPLHNMDGQGWSDLVSDNETDEIIDGSKDDVEEEEGLVSRVISRRDMATQMSPTLDSSDHHSLSSKEEERSSFSTYPPPILTIDELHNKDSSRKLEIRDVEFDKRANVIKLSKRFRKKNNLATNDSNPSWESVQTEETISRLQREEAKIAAWENLQKAKAEAEIRKLEMKLEKKRSASMDKILNRLTSAQKKAEEMRSSASDSYTSQSSPRTPPAKRGLFRKLNALSGCFTSAAL